jgi:hypothetical protein
MLSGDGNGDGSIDIDDKTAEWQMEAGKSGFWMEDYNMDGQVDNRDKDDCWVPNVGYTSAIPK